MSHTTRRVALLLTTMLLMLGAATSPAGAIVKAGAGEPPYTTSTTNTWWFNYNAFTPGETWWVCYTLYKDGVAQWTVGDQSHCFAEAGSGSGTQGISTSGLLNGHTYSVVAYDYYDQVATPSSPIYLNGSLTDSEITTIDTTAPSESVGVDGPATYTNDPSLAVHIDYLDSTSYPFAAQYGGVTSDCINLTTTCSNGSYDPGCSHANVFHGLSNSFDCTVTWGGADGLIQYCADEADDAIPDNPSGADQFTTKNFSNLANHSGYACGYITLDRVAPAVTAKANNATGTIQVTQGALVTLTATATDAGAGPDGVYDWDFGDNTAHGAGASTSHTYTQAGTYSVKATTHDNAKTVHSGSAPFYATGAGNAGQGTVTVQVNAAAGGGTTTPGGSSGGAGGSSGGSGGSGGGSGGSGGTVSTSATPGSTTVSSAGGVTVSLGCHSAACEGTVKLIATRKVRHGRKTKTTKILVGTGRYSLAAGKSLKTTLKLNAAGRKMLKAAGKLKVDMQLFATGSTTILAHKSLTLTAPKPKKRH